MNANNGSNATYVEELLRTYQQREQKIAVLAYELAHFTRISDREQLEAAAFARGSGLHTPGHISNRTLQIALNYREQASHMNTENVKAINDELEDLKIKQERLLFYVSLLEERQALVLRLCHFVQRSWGEIAAQLGVSVRTAQKIRSSAVEKLAELYSFAADIP